MSFWWDFTNAFDLLTEQGYQGAVLMFWYVLIFEVPRYSLSLLAFVVGGRFSRPSRSETSGLDTRKVSLVVVGHNEEKSLERCIRSLRAQSTGDFEIVVVSDGSSDRMAAVGNRLLAEGLVSKAFSTDLRCGKSAGVNLAVRLSSGEIIVNVDCDCSYDRFAIENILVPFNDPAVGAVSGDILPRNGGRSVVASLQLVEYLVSISLGKQIAEMFGLVVCASGAFGAFRRSALSSVGGLDVGGGEDLDVTMRLRAKGWKIAFASGALCYTDVPETSLALIRQRLRWERDALRIRFRKHRRMWNPLSQGFKSMEAIHQLDFFFFHVLLAAMFPLYLIYLFVQLGTSAIQFLVAVQIGLMFLDTIMFLLALRVTGRWAYSIYLFWIPAYTLFNGLFMRGIRLLGYAQEWFFDLSQRDNYVPGRVRSSRLW